MSKVQAPTSHSHRENKSSKCLDDSQNLKRGKHSGATSKFFRVTFKIGQGHYDGHEQV